MVAVTEEMLKQYDEQGYMIFEHLFDEEEMKELTRRIDVLDAESEERLRKIMGQQDGISRANQINFTSHLHRQDSYIERFVSSEKFVRITTSILGPDVKLYWNQSVYKRPEADRDFPWHQDNGYVPTDPVHYVTCWLALEDSTIENGCIWIQPGTHKLGFVEHRKTDAGWQCYFGDDPGIPVPLKQGSMVVFHSLLFHRSTPNLSNTTRKGYVIQYSVDGAKNPVSGKVFENGPVIARGGHACNL
jgi:phytanoyl-CoA hydroxylase